MPPDPGFRFLADEMVHGKVLAFLNHSGCHVIRSPKGFRNGEVYQLARDERRILLTQDNDFCNKKRYPPSATEGIVCIKVFPPTIANVLSHLHSFIHRTSSAKLKGKLTIVS